MIIKRVPAAQPKSAVVLPGVAKHDLCVCSPTGNGKTLAYALPIVQMLSRRSLQYVRALVVLPTRDLAMQVESETFMT